MALARDLSALPRPARVTPAGLAPDPDPRFIGVLAEAWAAAIDEHKPTARGTRIRHSDAGKCARAIAYTAARIPKSDPMDLAGVWNVSLGSLLHEEWQQQLIGRFPGAEIEVTCGWDDLDASGHIDAVIVINGITVAYELKSTGGYSFKNAVGKARRGAVAEGPSTSHLYQGALNAVAVNADELVIGYLAKECISVNVANGMPDLGRFAAEWTLSREQFEPLAAEEKARMAGILDLLDQGLLAARKVPGEMPRGAEIVDVATSRWEEHDADGIVVDTGSLWNGSYCAYCGHRTTCAQTRPGRIPVTDVTP